VIVESLTVGAFGENCYVVGDEASGIGAIIDPGDEATRIALAVEGKGLEIERILVTHAHIDHVGAVAQLAEEYACPVFMHADAEAMLKTVPQQAVMMGLRFGKVPAVDGHIADDDVVEIGPLRLRALYTPGHAPGHLAFFVEGEGVVFAGDALFAGSIGRTDLPGGNTDVLLRSIEEKLMTLPGETRVLPGHGPETTVGHEWATNPFLAGRMMP
jgi:glyoxylase-like metal-dependent hydrolase (beta-lactamase superfamily II)